MLLLSCLQRRRSDPAPAVRVCVCVRARARAREVRSTPAPAAPARPSCSRPSVPARPRRPGPARPPVPAVPQRRRPAGHTPKKHPQKKSRSAAAAIVSRSTIDNPFFLWKPALVFCLFFGFCLFIEWLHGSFVFARSRERPHFRTAKSTAPKTGRIFGRRSHPTRNLISDADPMPIRRSASRGQPRRQEDSP